MKKNVRLRSRQEKGKYRRGVGASACLHVCVCVLNDHFSILEAVIRLAYGLQVM